MVPWVAKNLRTIQSLSSLKQVFLSKKVKTLWCFYIIPLEQVSLSTNIPQNITIIYFLTFESIYSPEKFRIWKLSVGTPIKWKRFFNFRNSSHYTWTQDVNWTYIRHSDDLQEVFWTSYVRWIYVLCPGDLFQLLFQRPHGSCTLLNYSN